MNLQYKFWNKFLHDVMEQTDHEGFQTVDTIAYQTHEDNFILDALDQQYERMIQQSKLKHWFKKGEQRLPALRYND